MFVSGEHNGKVYLFAKFRKYFLVVSEAATGAVLQKKVFLKISGIP